MRAILVLLSCTFLIVQLLDGNDGNDGESSLRRLDENHVTDETGPSNASENAIGIQDDTSEDQDQRPIMYTFFDRIHEDERSTGMSDENDDAMLELWHEKWNAAGFQTKVLTMEDAKLHPRFQEFQQLVEMIPLSVPTKVYNQMCYYRHLAMALVGGGYMSDYDVLPLIKETPPIVNDPTSDQRDNPEMKTLQPIPIVDDDEIIVYSKTARNGGIPCLMSGSKQKWETLAFALAKNGSEHEEDRLWSDMLAMIELHDAIEDDPSSTLFYKVYNLVLKRYPYSDKDWELGKKYLDACPKIDNSIAVHFSHFAIKNLGHSAHERPVIAKKWFEDWKINCHEEDSSEAIM